MSSWKYYSLEMKQNPRFAVATTPPRRNLDWIGRPQWIKRYKPITFVIKRPGKLTDLLGNDVPLLLCSPRLRAVIDGTKTSEDVIQWLNATVLSAGVEHPYHILHFPERKPLLNNKATKWSEPGCWLVPVLDAELVKNRAVFNISEFDDLWAYVREDVKKAIEAAGCTGVGFERWPVA